MICVQFIFKPGTYDEDFHRLDGQIDDYARTLPARDPERSAEGALTCRFVVV